MLDTAALNSSKFIIPGKAASVSFDRLSVVISLVKVLLTLIKLSKFCQNVNLKLNENQLSSSIIYLRIMYLD